MMALSSVPRPFMALRRSAHRFSASKLGSGTMVPCPTCKGREASLVTHPNGT